MNTYSQYLSVGGDGAGSVGTYTLNGPGFVVVNGASGGQLYVGRTGAGSFNQSAGSVTVNAPCSIATNPGSAGTYNLSCALIIGWRSAQTDLKTSLNDVLREYEIAS